MLRRYNESLAEKQPQAAALERLEKEPRLDRGATQKKCRQDAGATWTIMKNTKSNAGQICQDGKCIAGEIWKQFEDLLVPRLGLSVVDRAAYSHLLRHSRLEGKVRLRFGILWLARGIGLSGPTTRDAVRRLVNHGALRLLARNKSGHLVDVRLPGEIRGIRARGKEESLPVAACLPMQAGELALPNGFPLRGGRLHEGTGGHPNIENLDFMQNRALRKAIHVRERGLCFYCLRRLTSALQGLDHVVPRAQSGSSSYRNLVSCCLDCNSRKGEAPAGDFLRWLFREGRLTAAELTGRLRALDDLASGKLPPPLENHRGHSCSAGFTPAVSCSGRSSDRCFSSCCGRAEFIPPAPILSGTRSGAQPPLLPASTVSASASTTPPPETASVSATSLAEIERITILRAFEQARGDKALATKMLGISRATLYRKLKHYNIPLKGAPDDVAAEPQPPS